MVAVSPEARPVSLGGRESSELTASDGNGDGKMSKAVNLCRSLGVGDKRKPLWDLGFSAQLSSWDQEFLKLTCSFVC